MAYRFPLYYDRSNDSLRTMTQAQLVEIVDAVRYEFGQNPFPSLLTIPSGGNFPALEETRLQAGTHVTHPSTFIDAPNTSTVTTTFQKLDQNVTNSTNMDTSIMPMPCYYDTGDGSIKHMSMQDVKDTFIYPALTILSDGTDQPGTYKVTTITNLAGHSVDVGNGAFYIDTRADASAYTSSSIPETQDQPTTITSYYIARVNNIPDPVHQYPMVILPDGNIHEYIKVEFRRLLRHTVRSASKFDTGFKIRYGYNDGSTHTSAGINMGTGITDTRLNNQTTGQLQVHGDDYRTQDFPSGTPITANTTFLRIRRD